MRQPRHTGEAHGWQGVATTDAGVTPDIVSCCELVVVDIEQGIGLLRRLALHAGPCLVTLLGWWDVRSADVTPWCQQFLRYPIKEAELVALLSKTDMKKSAAS